MSRGHFDISFWEKALPYVVSSFPLLTLIVGFVMEVISAQYPLPEGQWCMLIVMCWSLFYPSQLKVSYLLILGLLCDISIGAPLGVHGLSLVLLHLFVIFQRHFLENAHFLQVWALASFILLACMFVKGVLFFSAGTFLVLKLIWKNWIVTVGSFPLFYIFLGGKIQRWSHGKV